MLIISRLNWPRLQEYQIDIGIDRGVIYPSSNEKPYAFTGLISVTENTEFSQRPIYFDGQKIGRVKSDGSFSGSLESLTELASTKRPFGLSYRIRDNDHNNYKINIIYNVIPLSETKAHDHAISTHKIDFATLPINVIDEIKTSRLIIDTDIAYSWTLTALEEVLYGSVSQDPRLPTPNEIYQIFEDNSILQIIDLGDGSFKAIGPDNVVTQIDDSSYSINWPSVIQLTEDTYRIHSL